MELNNFDIEINQYINNELTGEALQKFEQLLKSDTKLAKEVALYKKIDQTLLAKKANKNEVELKALFQQFGEKYIINDAKKETEANDAKVIERNKNSPLTSTTPKEKSNNSILRWLAPIASVAAAALLIFFIGFGDADPKNLGQQYFEPYILDDIVRSDNINNLTLAQQAYDNKAYQKALNLFSKYPNNTNAQMAKGNCEIILDKPEKAVETFKPLTLKKIDIHQKAAANWYLALSFLELEKVADAKNSLQLIPTDAQYYKQAQAILKALD